MFAQHTAPPPPSPLLGPALISVLVHGGFIALAIWYAGHRVKPEPEKEVAVALMRQLPGPPPPPPPPPGGAQQVVKPQRKPTPHKEVVIRKPEKIELLKEEKPKEPEPEPEPTPEPVATPDPAGVTGGVQGGVAGGVVGGVVGGQLGGTPGGTGEAPKPKNVPPFVIQRDVVRQAPPRLSEVFKQAHRGTGTLSGMYRICVSTDGNVYEVTPVKPVPGADEDIISGIKEGWQYKPQKVPVCFLYNIPITIQ